MDESKQRALEAATDCSLKFDNLTRQLYATDASIYQIEPWGVAFPKSVDETVSVIRGAVEEDIPVIPRGAGTGLAGAAIGEGLVVDFSYFNRGISKLDLERRTVRVEPGVVLDQLNSYLKPHGLCFGPDVATSTRATLGGMINNNSSGARAPLYGTTIDHVASLGLVMADGRRVTIGGEDSDLPDIHEAVRALIQQHEAELNERCPEGVVKRWPGYGFERWLRRRPDLTRIIGGSEGTLAAVVSAELELSPLPKKKTLGAICFSTINEAMAHTVDIIDLEPAAIEHMDRVLFDQTKGQLAFKRARSLLKLDEEPCESILLVEFYDDHDGKLDALIDRGLGLRSMAFTDEAEMNQVWAIRKHGLTLLTGRKGSAKPYTGIEDVSVRVEQLPDYVNGLQELMKRLELEASFYGHAASGLLHVRPVVDLHDSEEIAKFRELADEVSYLVKEFKGSISAEHGVGIARTEYLPEHLGPEIMEMTREVKALFDPKQLMNPGKVIPDGRFKFDTNLRQGPEHSYVLPFVPELKFAAKDESFLGNLEQCNGNGACRKLAPTMCPTYRATLDESLSTRGYANTIRAVLEGRVGFDGNPLLAPELDNALSNCISCKACSTECPSNVNMALLKSELMNARHELTGVSVRERMLSRVDLLGEFASVAPGVTNLFLKAGPVRWGMEKLFGLSAQRPLPPYGPERFDRWFQRRQRQAKGLRQRVILWDDCFVRYHEPHIGKAAVAVLERAGFDVVLPSVRACCGRPAFSLGRLDRATEFAEYNIELLTEAYPRDPIIFLEPSCYSMLAEDYMELGLDGAREVAERSLLFEHFLADLLDRDPKALFLDERDDSIAIHGHCHAKALTHTSRFVDLAQRIPGAEVSMLDTGCCGMAGAYGAMAEKYDMSVQIAQHLLVQLQGFPEDAWIVASGTSCRHQIEHLTDRQPKHMAELLAESMARETEETVSASS